MQPHKQPSNRHLTGNIGLFYACYRLSQHDMNVLPTIRNAKGADIIVVDGARKYGVQVKSLSSQADVFLGKNYADASVDFWIILTQLRTDSPTAYIIPATDIIESAQKWLHGTPADIPLVYGDKPKQDGSVALYINNKFLRNGTHAYKDAWSSMLGDL